MSTVIRDVRYGLRGVARSRGFSLVVILTLALGVGVNTAMFSVVRSVLLKSLPYPDAGRLVWLGESTSKAAGISVTWVNYLHWRQENRSFDELAAYEQMHQTLTGRGEPEITHAALVTSNFAHLVGQQALLGRLFTEADDQTGTPYTIVLTHRFWTEKLGGDPKIIGATLALDGRPYQVIGVAAPAWEFFGTPDYYIPIGLFKSAAARRSEHGSIRALGRLKEGISLAAARSDLDRIMQRWARLDPGPEDDHRAHGAFLTTVVTGSVRTTLLILMAAVGLVLLIACANVAGLVLARSTARAKEMAVRAAVGAVRSRLAGQLLIENLLLAALGGAAGLLLAYWAVHVLLGIAPRQVPRLAETTLDLPVFLFAAAISGLTGLLAGLVPMWTAGKLDLVTALKESSRGVTGSKNKHTLRSALVVFEIALTLVLAFASGLLIRSLAAAANRDPGFRSEGLLALELVLPVSSYKDAGAERVFYEHLLDDLRSLPGVTDTGAVNCPPSAGDCGDWFYSVLDRPAPPRSEVPIALFNVADQNYFHVMQIPLREGRGFTPADRAAGARTAIVNETFARKWWPAEPAVGRRIKSGGPYFDGPVYEIVGVAGNVSQMGLDTEPLPEIYLPLSQGPSRAMVVMIRTAGDPESLAMTVRRRVAALDRGLPVQRLRAFRKTLEETLERRRFTTLLLSTFAALAMILAGVGIYGLLNYWVSVRETDIAIRMALGAERAAIVRWTGGHALRLAASGILLGAAAAFGVSHWMESLVFGISARNPGMLAAAALGVIALAALAALLPAWRATRIDAIQKLHQG
jgi:putative ABC transport system permease protein